ncbi:HI_0552 family protein [Priestia aryabhattai]|nr:HI_0552 family protein [Priestia aryabhattai]
MAKLANYLFTVFDRKDFTYRKINTDLMEEYRPKWNEWKKIVEVASLKKANNNSLRLDGTESWQDGRWVKKRFWTRIKLDERYKSSSCIAVMINKKNLRIYLEWHQRNAQKIGYSENTVKEHNEWVNLVEQWVSICNIPTSMYKVWTSLEQDYDDYIGLDTFLEDITIRNRKLEAISKKTGEWIRVGAVISKNEALNIQDIDEFIALRVNELHWILEETLSYSSYKNKRFWLFNVYHSKNTYIWKRSEEFGVAAMQYEKGKQNSASVTRQINLANQISNDDFIVSYTGNKGFLGIGRIRREFYNETNSEKFITLDGEHWRQRLGVEWFKVVQHPVYYKSNGFKSAIGLLDKKTVMGSSTIFEIDLSGFLFIKYLLENNRDEQINGGAHMFTNFREYVKARGFTFDQDLLNNYILSLKSKPFVILSGISGTGKTKIAQFFAEYMCQDEKKLIISNEEEASYIYKIQKYNIEYSRFTIPKRFEMYLDLPKAGETIDITVRVEDAIEKCKLYSSNSGKYAQLLFRGNVRSYIKNNYKVGESVRVTFEKEDETAENIITFNKGSVDYTEANVRSNRYLFLSVRPDWMDNKSLLGFYNPITEEYQITELLKLLLRASEDLERPYFVIFDEMNLAKVEYYFSDFLSCLESRRVGQDGVIRSEALHLHDKQTIIYTDEDETELNIPGKLEIPPNVYFTGTVNIDETTYMFSPKVLDRANVIEFNDVDLDDYELRLKDMMSNEIDVNIFADEVFVKAFTDEGSYHNSLILKEFTFDGELSASYKKLKEIHQLLLKDKLHFGYRVVDEVLYYLSNAQKLGIFKANDALDLQILQRILPKFHGNRKKLEKPLLKLLALSFGIKDEELKNYNSLQSIDREYLEGWIENQEITEDHSSIFANRNLEFPKTARKIYEMLKMLQNNGFVSYIQ